VKFTFVSTEKAWAPIAASCKVLQVSRSGYYAWDARGRSTRSVADDKLAVDVAASSASR
jgi:putative transposase